MAGPAADERQPHPGFGEQRPAQPFQPLLGGLPPHVDDEEVVRVAGRQACPQLLGWAGRG